MAMTPEEVSKQLTALTKEIAGMEKTVSTLSDKVAMLFVMAGDASRMCTENRVSGNENEKAIKELTKQLRPLPDKVTALFGMADAAVRLCAENRVSGDENEKATKDLTKRVTALEKKK
jgi:hypothetical protein